MEDEDLSQEKTEQLLQFQDLTGIEDISRCRELLETHGWNIEAAVQARFSETDDDDLRSQTSHLQRHPPQLNHTSGGRGSGGGGGSLPNRIRNDLSMPPVNLHPPDQRVFLVHRRPVGIMGWGYWIVSFPFHFFYSRLFSLLRFAYRLLRPDPRAILTDPLGDVQRFIESFRETYGDVHPTFFNGTYSMALNEAKKELQFLIVYLHGDDHQDTPSFCRNVLCSRRVTELINSRALFWACSTNSPEGYRVSQALRENTYPFLAVIVIRQNKMTVVARLEGSLDTEELLSRLVEVMGDNEACLITARADREERSFNQLLRQEQDEAYHKSLVADQEKARLRREEVEKIEEKEREAEELVRQEQLRVEEVERKKERMRDELPPEPESDSPDMVRILLKLPSGARLERRFNKHDPITVLHNYVYVHELAPDNFQIVKNFPRTIIPCQPPDTDGPVPTFEEVGLGKSELLFVHDNEA